MPVCLSNMSPLPAPDGLRVLSLVGELMMWATCFSGRKNNNKRVFNLQRQKRRKRPSARAFPRMGRTDINYSAHSGAISCDRPNPFKEIIKHPHRAGRPTEQTQRWLWYGMQGRRWHPGLRGVPSAVPRRQVFFFFFKRHRGRCDAFWQKGHPGKTKSRFVRRNKAGRREVGTSFGLTWVASTFIRDKVCETDLYLSEAWKHFSLFAFYFGCLFLKQCSKVALWPHWHWCCCIPVLASSLTISFLFCSIIIMVCMSP